MDVEVDAELRHQASRLPRLFAPEDATASPAREAVTEREIVHRAQLEDETEILVDESQTRVRRVARVTERERLAVELGLRARVRVVIPGEDLDQRRLPRAVLSDERMDLALADVERGVDQRTRSGERLGQVLEAQHTRSLRSVVPGSLSGCVPSMRHGGCDITPI